MATNPLISQITLPSGTTYDIKDAYAREQIESLTGDLTGGVHYLGSTTTTLSDGATTNPIVIGGENITAKAGDLVINGQKEFIWSDITNGWREFGDLSSIVLGDLASKDSASGTYTPEGIIGNQTFSGTLANLSLNYTPEGGVSQATFTGTAGAVTTSFTPEGTISTPNITVTPSETTVNSITGVGTLPELSTTVSNETLTIGFSQGTLPTQGANTTVLTGASAALSGAPVFTGTAGTATGTFTPTGTISEQTFSGTAGVATGTYTPAGTISQATFTGTQATIEVE